MTDAAAIKFAKGEIKRCEKHLTKIPDDCKVAQVYREYIAKLKAIINAPAPPPMCQECDEEMYRYEDALDTGKGGYQCPTCSWSMDDD
jgi:tRNA(Ile2) C34 agmatinyltransferase TiaS